jgi:hypothetical protein
VSEHDTQPGKGNGALGAQIVAEAVAAYADLTDADPDAIDGIMKAAVYAGGTSIERDLIWQAVSQQLTGFGIGRQAFTKNWTRLEADLRKEERQADREKEAADNAGMTDDEMAQAREELYPQVRPLLDHPDILDAVATAVNTLGAAGVEAESKALYLAGISALSQQPLSIDVHGPSSVGKSYFVRKVLMLFPAEGLYEFTSASAKVFFYEPDDDVLKHKIVYAGEATAFYAHTRDGEEDASAQAAALIRQLQSEHKITHKVTQKNDAGQLVAVTITREGPIALIVTSTQDLHTENANRNLIIHLKETHEQTRTIIDKRTVMRMNPGAAEMDLVLWHNLYFYLAYGPTNCVVPYAGVLGRLLDDRHIRMRRDVDAIISAIEAHTLLNQARRSQDRQGRWIATLADYAAVEPVFTHVLAHGREDVISDGSRRLHEHIAARISKQEAEKGRTPGKRPRPLRKKSTDLPDGTLTITGRQIAAELGMGQTSVFRYLRDLYDLQLLKNLETRPRQPLSLRVLAALPATTAVSVLPSAPDLGAAWEKEKVALSYPPQEQRSREQ